MISKVRGTQDFLNCTLLNELLARAREALNLHNFTQISTPILEHLDLFKRSLGEHTEVVTKQMFIIESAHDAQKICLRPEATASTMRAFLEHGGMQGLPIPWKVFSYGPMFRHERPQKGRYREFHQCNIEIIGTHSIWYDIELITLLDRLFSRTFSLNSYALLINFLGCQHDRATYKEKLYAFVTTIVDTLCEFCIERKEKNLLRVLDCKNEQCQTYYSKAPRITDCLCAQCQQEWQELRQTLDMVSVSYSHLPTLVRGLDYYDKTVFEFVSSQLGAQTAFCGGGRYNGLAQQLGASEPIGAVGASIGIERLLLLLEQNKEQFVSNPMPVHVIIPLSKMQYPLALLLADQLYNAQLCVELLLDEASVKSMMRKANKMGARNALIIGETEQQQGTVMVKNLMTGHEEQVEQTKVAAFLKVV